MHTWSVDSMSWIITTVVVACAAASLAALATVLLLRRRVPGLVHPRPEAPAPLTTAAAGTLDSTQVEQRAAEVEGRIAELERRGVEADQRAAEIEARGQALETSERVRNLLISKLSHDVRTPLNSIITLSQLLNDGSAGALGPDQRKYAEVIHRSGQSLLALINDLLDLSHIEAGRFDLQMGAVDVRPLIRGVGAASEERARAKGLPVHINPPRLPILASADEDRLRQTLATLVDHAIQETTNGYVELSGEGDERQVVIRISDTGPGSTPELRRADFESFLTQTSLGKSPGPGLILAGKLARLMGGALVVDSAPGEGTTFSLTLARDNNGASAAAKTPEPVPGARSGAPAHVLLIEDDELERGRVAELLQGAGYRVSVASSGQEGLNRLREGRFDAVVLDLVMPGMTGLDVLRAARTDDRLSATPFVVLSALYMTRSEREVLGPTVAAVVRKGEGTADELTTFLARALAARGARDTAPAPVTTERLARVLLVEDDDDNLFAIEQVLASLPVTIETATTGRDAIEICRRRAPNLILMDVERRGDVGESGLDVSADIRRLPDCADIPIIALTATAERTDRDPGTGVRGDTYLSKPVKPGDVVSAVSRALQLGIH